MNTLIATMALVMTLQAAPQGIKEPADAREFAAIAELLRQGNRTEAAERSRRFLREHRQSVHVPDARMVIAECSNDPEEALKLFALVRDNYRYYPRRDRAQLRICEIHFFLSQWQGLFDESGRGIDLFTSGSSNDTFHYYRALAAAQLGRLDLAHEECLRMIETSREYGSMARSLLLLSYVIRQKTGNSRDYIYSLRELALGFTKSDITPSTIYLLGKFYESREDWNKAFSAYSDITKRYPRSPEANFSLRRLKALKDKKPRREPYLPDDSTISNTDQFDLQPETDLAENDALDQQWHYSLSIGPFSSRDEAARIERSLAEFGSAQLARTKSGYHLYLGRYPSSDDALTTRIRLAEELGINAHIVRVSHQSRLQYIYGE
jgi:hypothetical protein